MAQDGIHCLAVPNTVRLHKEANFLVNWEVLAAQAGLCPVELI